jgi:hypothetical protein
MSLYVTPENQKLLWNTLHKSPLIVQVFPINQTQQKEQWFKSIIENFFNQYRFKTLSKRDLQQLNQDTLTYMMQQLRDYLSKSSPQNNVEPKSNNTMINTPPIQQNNRQDIYNNQFQQRQKEYEQMQEKKAPDTVDFRDKVDDEPISNMDELLKSHMQMRENELKQYAPPPPVPTVEQTEKQVKEVEPSKPKNAQIPSNNNEIQIIKDQVAELIKKMSVMQAEIDSLKIKQHDNISINTEETT